MRIRRSLLTLLVVSSSLLVALPLAAHAEPVIDPTPASTVTSLSAPVTIAARETTTVAISVVDTDGAAVPDAPVSLVRFTTTGEIVLATGTTNASGHFSANVAPKSTIRIKARFAGTAALAASESDTQTVMPRVELGKPWTHDAFAYPEQWLPARGTLWPTHASSSTATKILCERLENGVWVLHRTYPTTIVNSKGASRYKGKFRVPASGTWRIRVRHEDEGHARSYSISQRLKVTRWRDRYVGKRVHGYKAPSKMVAITIDDGPNTRTPEICRILEKYGAKGTFFFTNQLLRRGSYMTQARLSYDRGHEIANHTAKHDMLNGPYAFDYKSVGVTKTTIREATGFSPIWVRPMGGGINSVGDRAIKNSGQLCAIWSLDSYDSHARYTPPTKLYRNVVDHVRSGDVILIHQTHAESVEALPRICATLKARGYKMVTLSELASVSRAR
ncbi:MAG: polysaccharide deacetylase family protein [Coriobacteriia bacterium]|nr:polysaccharide deacetylase family protein [Coriobacteriia bacterium]